jgi:iron complex outermembrane receptor protein
MKISLAHRLMSSAIACTSFSHEVRAQQSDAAQGAGQVQEVVVTAQKRNEKLEDVPISVSAHSARQIISMGVKSTSDLAVITPGLTYTVATGYSAPYLRGIGSNNVGPGTESPIATYVDGVYIATPTAAVFALNGISEVDVLKGPQGTLFGRNATGGVIQVTTLDPAWAPAGDLSVGYGDYGTFEGKLYATAPLSQTVAMNFAALYQDQGQGFGRNLTTGLPINETSTLALRSKLQWEVSPATQVTAGVDFTNLRTSEGISWRPADGARTILGGFFTGGQQDIYSNLQPLVRDSQGGVSITLDHDLGWARLVDIVAYRRERLNQTVDTDYGLPVNLSTTRAQTDNQQTSEELQLRSPDESSLKWLVGLYGFSSDGRYDPATLSGEDYAPLSLVTATASQQALSGALFGQATQQVAAATDLTLGLRYTVEQRRTDVREYGTMGDLQLPLGSAKGSKTFSAPTWRIALDHKFSSDVMAYLSYDRGFKSGQFQTAAIPTVVVKPETVDAVEGGLKSIFFERRLRFNLAAFYSLYSNMQVPSYGQGLDLEVLRNAASARIYGLDADADFAATSDLRFTAGLEALHGTYDLFPGAQVSTPLPGGGNVITTGDASGNHIILTPAFTGFVSADWRLPISARRLDANLTYSYNSGWYADPDNRLRQAGFSQVNAKLTWTILSDKLSLSVWGRNLTNEVYAEWLSDSPSTTDVYTPSPPRTFGAALDAKF